MNRQQNQRNVHPPQKSQHKSAEGSAQKKLKRPNIEVKNEKRTINRGPRGTSPVAKRDSINSHLKDEKLNKNLRKTPPSKKGVKHVKSLEDIAIKGKNKKRDSYNLPTSSKRAKDINSFDYMNTCNDIQKKKGYNDIKKSKRKANSLEYIPTGKKEIRKRDFKEITPSKKYGDSDSSDISIKSIQPRRIVHSDTDNLSVKKGKSHHASKKNLKTGSSKKVSGLMSQNPLPDKQKQLKKIHGSDSSTKKYILSEVIKYNKKEMKRHKVPLQVTQTREESFNRLLTASTHKYSDRKNELKRKIRRQVWQWSKNAIRNSDHWSKIMAENNIDIDKIKIDKVDLSLIRVDALEIENKLLKRAIIWLLK